LKRHIRHIDALRDVLLVVIAAVALLWPPPSGSSDERLDLGAAPPRIYGAYKVTFAGFPGYETGKGRAVVTPTRVKIDGTLSDAAGNQITVDAPDLAIDRSSYRFKGTGTVGGVAMTIAGRLDADDRGIRKCRIVATFVATSGKAARVAGEHN
jgi:hypothetical protein